MVCRLVDGSVGEIPARWTDLPRRTEGERSLGVVATPTAWRLLGERLGALKARRPGRAQRSVKTEVSVSGQLALVMGEQTVVGAAVWETLPPGTQQAIVLALARLLARLVEEERDE